MGWTYVSRAAVLSPNSMSDGTPIEFPRVLLHGHRPDGRHRLNHAHLGDPPGSGVANEEGVILMKKMLLTSTAFVALASGAAMAADLGRPPPAAPVYTKAPPVMIYSWSGCYVDRKSVV